MRINKHISTVILLISVLSFSQSRGVKIGYIDMDYILEKVPDYAEAKNQLEQKAQKWKQEIEVKKNDVKALKEALNTEKVLLTKELIEEREEEIAFLEKELLDYQEKRFGARGDLIIQKSLLVKPIQDQIFTAIQDIAETKKYDFIFDKSSDLTMLFAAQRFDISDQVVRILTRIQKREQLSKKQLKEQDAKEAEEDMIDENPAMAERQRILDERKAAREKLLEEKKQAAEERKRLAAEKRQKLIDEREAKKNGTVIETNNSDKEDKNSNTGEKDASKEKELTAEEKRQLIIEERKLKAEERKKALEEKRRKILEEREAAKKAKEEENKKEE
jgi:Skp family chaperone for outer membrane proteins